MVADGMGMRGQARGGLFGPGCNGVLGPGRSGMCGSDRSGHCGPGRNSASGRGPHWICGPDRSGRCGPACGVCGVGAVPARGPLACPPRTSVPLSFRRHTVGRWSCLSVFALSWISIGNRNLFESRRKAGSANVFAHGKYHEVLPMYKKEQAIAYQISLKL